MLKDLKGIVSIINNSVNAKDVNNAFTFIEFIKEYGFENEQYSFLTLYKEYLSEYSKKQNEQFDISIEEYVRKQMIEVLKTITLTYSSYDEQRFIKNLDWSKDETIKTLIPFYSRKIQEICKFYRRKRSEIGLIVKKNSSKGSKKSIEQIIYDKIVDFMFNNKENLPQISTLQRDLSISIENYVDIYSDYFDIPRDEKLQDMNRSMLSANMNDVDYRVYLEIEEVISDILYNGKVYLKEIPFIADLALDLSQDCVGDLAKLRDELVRGATINRIPLNEQVALKRRLYEKYVGCDLYYLYSDADKNTSMGILLKAKNPTGNLLNGPNPDTVTTESDDYKLLSKIGLFFKPEKLSFLKINSKSFEWSIDKEKLKEDTMYIFPDPSKYGDIGNNKTDTYPLMIHHNLDYEIKNLSLGNSKNDPLVLLEEAGWNSYYSKQQDDFKIKSNDKYQYAFSFLANNGLLHSYQIDIFGNEFGIFKGYNKKTFINEDGEEKTLITISSNSFNKIENKNDINSDDNTRNAMIINGGYFENPEPTYKGKGFDYSINKIIFNENRDFYRWSGVSTISKWNLPESVTPYIDFGTFETGTGINYIDHYGDYDKNNLLNDTIELTIDEDIRYSINKNLLSIVDSSENENNVIINLKKYTSEELDNQFGKIYIKDTSSYNKHPQPLLDKFEWLKNVFNENEIINYSLVENLLVLNTKNKFIISKYNFDGEAFYNAYPYKEIITIEKNGELCSEPLFVESKNKIYIAIMKKVINGSSINLYPTIYCIDIENYENEIVLNLNNNNFEDDNFELPYSDNIDINKIIFSYNNNLKLFLIAYVYKNFIKTPQLYEHVFKLEKNGDFGETLESCVYKTASSELTSDSKINLYKTYIYNKYIQENEENVIWCSVKDKNSEYFIYKTQPFFTAID